MQHQLGESRQTITDLVAKNHSLETAQAALQLQQLQQQIQSSGSSSGGGGIVTANSEPSSAVPTPTNSRAPVVLSTTWARSAARPVDKATGSLQPTHFQQHQQHHSANVSAAHAMTSDAFSDRDTNESPLEGQSQSGSLLFVAEVSFAHYCLLMVNEKCVA